MIKRILTIASVVLAAGFALAVQAADGDVPYNSVRIGAYYVTYDTTADDITGPYVPGGVNLKLKDLFTPYFAYIRQFNKHIGMELALGVPPLTKTYGKGPAFLGSVPYNDQEIATARWFAPTLLLTYTFLDESAPVRPYIGAGVNYTRFYSRQVTPAGQAATGGPTSYSLPASVGPAATVGLSWRFLERFTLNGSLSASEVDSTFTTNTAGVIRKTHISFAPRTAVLSLGYLF